MKKFADCICDSDRDNLGLCAAGIAECYDDCPFYPKMRRSKKRGKPSGLYVKYNVFKVGESTPIDNCFVLRPDKDPAAVEALRAYATATENKQLSSDIIEWVGEPQPLTLEELRSMDGEPVYIIEWHFNTQSHNGHWELSEDANDYLEDREKSFYGLTKHDSDKLHPLGWLAYRTKPKEAK